MPGIPTSTGAVLPYFDPARGFTYTREQIREMQERGRQTDMELETRQGEEGGDGIAEDLEQKAAEDAATDRAVEDAAGARVPPGAEPGAAGKNVVPLALLAALAFFAMG